MPLPPPPVPVDPGRLARHIRALAAPEMAGRAPGTPGEGRAVAWLETALRDHGLEPAFAGSYRQPVAMEGFRSTITGTLNVAGETLPLRCGADLSGGSRWRQPRVELREAPLVFAGHGIQAPEFGWDDFKGLDPRGKVLLVLAGDPALRHPDDPGRWDETMFKGRALSYYGRWTCKFDLAARLGAAGILLIHETGRAGYPWAVVEKSWGKETLQLRQAHPTAGRTAFEGWLHLDRARQLLAHCGFTYAELEGRALQRDFRPIPLAATATLTVDNASRDLVSANVAGVLPGADPAVAGEAVVLSAHWDHLGTDPALAGDPVHHGALDNASGIAACLELARLWQALPERPRRPLVVLFPTAEESGLLGARHFATQPLPPPLQRVVAGVNLDTMNLWGATRTLISIGHGQSDLEDWLAEAAAAQGRTVVPDPEGEKGYLYRGDNFEFMRRGVPALAFLLPGGDYAGQPDGWGLERRARYIREDYHRPSDHFRPDWDYAGAVQDVELFFAVTRRIAGATVLPGWKPGSEFARPWGDR